MGKDKRKGKERSSTFDYMTGGGKIGKLMDRYDIEGASYGSVQRGGTQRSQEDVDRDIAEAMRGDYDTRRSMEAAAMAGDKEAGKFAKKGFKEGNIYSAYDKMKALKKEHVGGGGMNGAKNTAGLTHALVQHDRRKQTEGYNKDFALGADLAALKEEMNGRFDEQAENVTPSTLAEDPPADKPTDDYELNLGGTGTDIFGGGSPQEQEQAEEFKTNAVANVKKGIQLSNVETRGPRSGVRPGAGF